jgi:hypothetical protein
MPTFRKTQKEVGIVLIPLAQRAKEDKVRQERQINNHGFKEI